MRTNLPAEFQSESYNTCVGCGLAVYPGETVRFKPGWGYPTLTIASYGRDEVICTRCSAAVQAVTHEVNCHPCLNPNLSRPHEYNCPERKDPV